MRKVVMYIAQPASNNEANGITVKNIDSTYEKSELEQVSYIEIHMNPEERNMLLGPINYFEELFDGTIGKWDT